MLQIIGPVTNVKNINVNNPKILMRQEFLLSKILTLTPAKY
jgi:hypothetical protein